MEPISAERLRDVIITLRNQYVEEGKVKTFEEINSGLCVEFAEEVQSHFRWIEDRFFIVNSDEFKVLDPDGEITGHEDWDAAEVEKWGLKPPLPWEEMNKIDFGYHVWLVFDGRFYDAECPEGVNFFDLPFYKSRIPASPKVFLQSILASMRQEYVEERCLTYSNTPLYFEDLCEMLNGSEHHVALTSLLNEMKREYSEHQEISNKNALLYLEGLETIFNLLKGAA